MRPEFTLFISTFTTLLAIINPFESMPVFLQLMERADEAARRKVARDACTYTMWLCFFFLVFGTVLMRVFGAPLSMIRIAGGIVLMRIGFDLFTPSAPKGSSTLAPVEHANIAFVPLAMPLMFGPGAIATVLGMAASVKHSADEALSFISLWLAILATMAVTYLCLVFAGKLSRWLGRNGIDAITRIVGFFVSAMGVSLIFEGVIEALQMHGVTMLH